MFLIEIDDGTGYVNLIYASTYELKPTSQNSGVFEFTVFDIKEKIHTFNVRVDRITGWVTELDILELTSGTGELPKIRKIFITQ
jgi:hypothetical protein